MLKYFLTLLWLFFALSPCSSVLSSDGSLDMFAIMKALYETGFDGPIRPDHGRTIWGEVCMPGYGFYNRALGASYLRSVGGD